MPCSRGSAAARRCSHKAGSTWSECWSRSIESSGSMHPFWGIPLDHLNPTLDIPSEFSRRASIFDHSPGIPDSSTRDRLSNPFGGSACDLSRFSWVHTLAYRGRNRPWQFTFLPVGASFQAGADAALCRRGIHSVPSVREIRTVKRRIYGGSYHIHRICPLVGCRL